MFENNIKNVYKIVVSRVKTFIVRIIIVMTPEVLAAVGRRGIIRERSILSITFIIHPNGL